MSSCTTSPIELIRRDDADIEATFRDSDGNLIDLTGCKVFFTVKSRLQDTDEDAVISKTITLFSGLDTGIAIISLTDTDTDISPGVYYFDIQLRDTNSNITSTHAGRLIVTQDVTIRIT